MKPLQLLVAGALALSACSGSGTSTAQDDEPATEPPAIAGETSSSAVTTSTFDPSVASSSTTDEVSTTAESSTTTEPTSTTATTAESSPATTLVPSSTGLVLERVGIGPLRFGASPEPAIEFLAGALGTESSDSGWGPSFSAFGTCPGTEVRGVTFGPLTVLFGDPDGEREFYAWTYNEFTSTDLFGLATTAGIGLGSTSDDIAAAYQDLQLFDDEIFGSTAQFDGLFASLADTGDVIHLGGGRLCGE